MCDFRQEAWGSLTEVCENHSDFKYYTLSRKENYNLEKGFEYKGWLFKKVKYRQKSK